MGEEYGPGHLRGKPQKKTLILLHEKMACLWWCGVSTLDYPTGKNLPQSISQIIKVETDIHTCNI